MSRRFRERALSRKRRERSTTKEEPLDLQSVDRKREERLPDLPRQRHEFGSLLVPSGAEPQQVVAVDCAPTLRATTLTMKRRFEVAFGVVTRDLIART